MINITDNEFNNANDDNETEASNFTSNEEEVPETAEAPQEVVFTEYDQNTLHSTLAAQAVVEESDARQKQSNLQILLRGASVDKGLITIPAPRWFYSRIKDAFLERDIQVADLDTTVEFREHAIQLSHDDEDQESMFEDVEGEISDKVFDRYSLRFELPEQYDIVTSNGTRHSSVIGCVVATDVQQPFIKVYFGHINKGDGTGAWACLNLSIFSAASVAEVFLSNPNFDSIFAAIPTFLDRVEQENEKALNILNNWNTIRYSGNKLYELVGRLTVGSLSLAGLQTAVTTGLKLLFNRASLKVSGETIENIYFNEAKTYTMRDIFEACTVTTTRGDMGAVPMNTVRMAKLFTGIDIAPDTTSTSHEVE